MTITSHAAYRTRTSGGPLAEAAPPGCAAAEPSRARETSLAGFGERAGSAGPTLATVVEGFAVLFGWLAFLGMLGVLGWFVLRRPR